MYFDIDKVALGILLVGVLGIGFLKNLLFPSSSSPTLSFSRVKDLQFSSWRSKWLSKPAQLHIAALACFMFAFIDPHFLYQKSTLHKDHDQPIHIPPTEGHAIYLVLDQSGSMQQTVAASGKSTTKLDLMKSVTKQFILDHPSDLIGLISFARVPRVIVPLTLDQKTLLNQLEQIQPIKNPEQDGTAMGYAIYKTAQLISASRHFASELKDREKPPYTIKNAMMIVVTDGFQDPSRLDRGNRLRTMELDEAATYAKSTDTRLYVINIDPTLATSQYAPQRRQLQSVTSLTGGHFYLVSNTKGLQEVYSDIDRLEKGTIEKQMQLKKPFSISTYSRFSMYPFLIALGLLNMIFALFLELFVLKVVP